MHPLDPTLLAPLFKTVLINTSLRIGVALANFVIYYLCDGDIM